MGGGGGFKALTNFHFSPSAFPLCGRQRERERNYAIIICSTIKASGGPLSLST